MASGERSRGSLPCRSFLRFKKHCNPLSTAVPTPSLFQPYQDPRIFLRTWFAPGQDPSCESISDFDSLVIAAPFALPRPMSAQVLVHICCAPGQHPPHKFTSDFVPLTTQVHFSLQAFTYLLLPIDRLISIMLLTNCSLQFSSLRKPFRICFSFPISALHNSFQFLVRPGSTAV